MTKDKQIEEMAIALSEGGCGRECDCDTISKFECKLLYDAELLYTAGYRKASDVAREIFEEIEKICNDYNRYEIGERGLFAKLYELKKKYTESEGTE